MVWRENHTDGIGLLALGQAFLFAASLPVALGSLVGPQLAIFGANLLFMDVDRIPLGSDFNKVLREEVGKCDTLLAVIGRHWLDARDAEGKRRLDNENDFVRVEIATALQT